MHGVNVACPIDLPDRYTLAPVVVEHRFSELSVLGEPLSY